MDDDYFDDDYTLSRVEPGEGPSFLLSWLGSLFFGDDQGRRATRRVLYELLVFYALVFLGFIALYFTWKSNGRVKEWKRNVQTVVENQRGRKFEPQDAAKMYGMF